ncbi:MAG: polysaccharide biosynthesis/export family protein, partial [Planctomycetota bacterium]
QLQPDGSATPIVSVILDDLDLGVTPPDQPYANARDVTAEDLEVKTADYVIGPGDQLRVTIFDYPQPGGQLIDAFEVTATGVINLPDVREVSMQGLTETQAARAIEEAYVRAQIFRDGAARVNVLAFTKQNRTFTIIGNAVGRANRYVITQPNFRLLDAIALAGGATNAQILNEFVYIIRDTSTPEVTGRPDPANPGNQGPVRPGEDDPLAPRSEAEEISEWEPVYAQDTGTGGASGGFAFEAPQEPENTEVIRVPITELLNGQLKFNIVIRPGDTVIMEAEQTGVYYVGGNAAVTGVFQISPQNPVTLKRAIVAARGFNPVAIPQRTQLIRKMGDQDVFVRVNLKKIFLGQEPDLYVKPDDMIMVGTNFPAPFLAALRNGFRVSYGFGFLYDRNLGRDRREF